jgi:hypothetical protein
MAIPKIIAVEVTEDMLRKVAEILGGEVLTQAGLSPNPVSEPVEASPEVESKPPFGSLVLDGGDYDGDNGQTFRYYCPEPKSLKLTFENETSLKIVMESVYGDVGEDTIDFNENDNVAKVHAVYNPDDSTLEVFVPRLDKPRAGQEVNIFGFEEEQDEDTVEEDDLSENDGDDCGDPDCDVCGTFRV